MAPLSMDPCSPLQASLQVLVSGGEMQFGRGEHSLGTGFWNSESAFHAPLHSSKQQL